MQTFNCNKTTDYNHGIRSTPASASQPLQDASPHLPRHPSSHSALISPIIGLDVEPNGRPPGQPLPPNLPLRLSRSSVALSPPKLSPPNPSTPNPSTPNLPTPNPFTSDLPTPNPSTPAPAPAPAPAPVTSECPSCAELPRLLKHAIAHCRREEDLNNRLISSHDTLRKRLNELEASNIVLQAKLTALEDANTDTTVSDAVVQGEGLLSNVAPSDAPLDTTDPTDLPQPTDTPHLPITTGPIASSQITRQINPPVPAIPTASPKPFAKPARLVHLPACLNIRLPTQLPAPRRGRPDNPVRLMRHVLSVPAASTALLSIQAMENIPNAPDVLHTPNSPHPSNTPNVLNPSGKPSKPNKPNKLNRPTKLNKTNKSTETTTPRTSTSAITINIPVVATEARLKTLRGPAGDFTISKMSFKDLMTTLSDSTNEKYSEVILSVRQLAHAIVCDEFSESVLEKGLDEPKSRRIHDWTGRFEKLEHIPTSIPAGNPPLRLAPNIAMYGVPMCPLQLSETSQFYTPRFRFPAFAMEIAFEKAVTTHSSMQQLRYGEARMKALDAVRADAITKSLFAKAMVTRQGNHKRTCRNRYFSLLEYDTFWSSSVESKHSFARDREKQMIYNTLVRGVTSSLELDQIEEVDCTWWRKASWSDVHNPDKHAAAEPPVKATNGSTVDVLFKNNAAREAYIALMGRQPSESDSLLSLARADAWYTTVSLLILLPEGIRGARKQVFSKTYAKLLPRCAEGIMHEFRQVVSMHAPDELLKKDVRMFLPLDPCARLRKTLRVGDRKVTDVVYLPSQQKHYVYVLGSAFKALICDWVVFTDAYVGRATISDSEFHPVIRPVTVDENADDVCEATGQECWDDEDHAAASRCDDRDDDDVPLEPHRGGGRLQKRSIKMEDVEATNMGHGRKRLRDEIDLQSASADEDEDML